MERLTYRLGEKALLNKGADAAWRDMPQYDILCDAIEKLAKYEEAEDKGYLVISPVKRGDLVYRTTTGGREGYSVKQYVVDRVNMENFPEITFYIKSTKNTYATVCSRPHSVSEIGKTIFLSQEEAERIVAKEKRDKKTARKTAELMAKIKEAETVDIIIEVSTKINEAWTEKKLDTRQFKILNDAINTKLKQIA